MAGIAKAKRLAIIDGKSVYYRGYYAMPNLATKDGQPTGGIYGFAVLALELIKKLQPDYVCVAWDKPKTNIRKRREIYPEYKGNRKPAPADFYEQIPKLHELLDAFGWPLYELDDYEADDIMGTFARQASEQGIETMLVTSDLDLLQVISDDAHVYALKKGFSNIDLYHPESFEAKHGIRVEQFLDLKSLKGDSSDNIPGAPGIGEKTAVALLNQYDNLDNIYAHVDEIKGATRQKLIDGKELVYMSKELARIWTDAPVEFVPGDADGQNIKPADVIRLFDELQFRTLAVQARQVLDLSGSDVLTEREQKQFNGDIVRVSSSEMVADLPQANKIFIHSVVADALGKNIATLIFAHDDKKVYVVDKDVLENEKLTQTLLEKIAVSQTIVGHDVKAFVKVLLQRVIAVPKVFDLKVAAFLHNSLEADISLQGLALQYAQWGSVDLGGLDTEQTEQYAGDIVRIIVALDAYFSTELAKYAALRTLTVDVEMPMVTTLARMELAGIRLDVSYLAQLEDELKEALQDCEQEIYGHAEQEFNIASPKQLSEVLFDSLGLPTFGIKKGKTGYSTAASELSKLRLAHPIIDGILQYREIAKLLNTYVQTLPNDVAEDGRVHTSYSLTTAQTGRLSSLNPNLQNIPIKTELGNKVRRAFVASDGKVFISADYSQFELRIAAVLSKDTETIELFNNGIDVHAATAAQMYGREQEDVTKTMRRDAKVINFGVLYGMSPHGLSEATGMNIAMAKEYIDKYFQIRGPLLAYLEGLKQQARDEGFVETLYGRRRYTPDVKSSNFVVRSAAERAAMNMPIQGTASDIMKIAMLRLDAELVKIDGAEMLLQIHDSVLVEVDEDKAEQVATIIKNCMQDAVDLPINIDVDTTTGKTWADL
jgi:DNA polymerase I